MSLNLPARGFSFPHVGNGDATTIAVVEDEVYIQVDLNHCSGAEDDDDPRIPVIDDLKKELRVGDDGKPYLSLFVLTHPDLDHCRGFERLLKEVTIGEIIHTPRIFREYEKQSELSDDAKAFRNECDRRRKKTVEAGGDPGAGHRVRVVGYDDLFQEDRYKDFPTAYRHSAGDVITEVDGEELSDTYEMFVHGPLRDEHAGNRNDSSLAFQIVLTSDNGEHTLKGLFFGDRTAPKIRSVINETQRHGNDKEGRLEWHVLLTPHHCSKHALFEEDEDGVQRAQSDIINTLTTERLDPGYVVASCRAVDDDGNSAFTNGKGDDPPHEKARRRYESMVASKDDFLCTGEQPDTDRPEPIVFSVADTGIERKEETTSARGDEAKHGVSPGWGAPAIAPKKQPSSKPIEHG